MTLTVDRMVDSAPGYYQYSNIYRAIQQAQGDEYDDVEAKNEDLRAQLYITTATWGLKYWEETLGIATVESDSYEIRRSRVLSSWRGYGQFSASLLKSIAEAYVNGEVDVTVDVAAYEITIRFISDIGVPPNLWDLKAVVENIVHAHMGTQYKLRYLTIAEVEALTLDEVQARQLTDFSPFIPIQ